MKVLIVGQGIAGTVLHFQLLKEGIQAIVADVKMPGSSSVAAAGIINPLTGRKFVKSWMFDELLPVFLKCYRELSELLDCQIIQPLELFRYLKDENQYLHWQQKMEDENYRHFCSPEIDKLTDNDGDYLFRVMVMQAYQVNMNFLLSRYREYLIENDLLINTEFNYQEVKPHTERTLYQDEEFDYIIFCEGFRIMENPYFKYLPVIPNLGKALICDIPGIKQLSGIKKRNLACNWEAKGHWYGASMEVWNGDWSALDEAPDDLVEALKDDFPGAGNNVGLLAGIRPTVKDRRPILGPHPEYNSLICFNGLGTKGVSLAPLMAEWLCNWMVHSAAIPKEVSVKRWERLYQVNMN